MATKISTEVLIMILKNVPSFCSTQDLYSSLLVNRIWCKVTIPILWEQTLNQGFIEDWKLKRKSLCIRTYISCLDTQARILLTQNGFVLSSSPPHATFDYLSFTYKLAIDDLVNFISTYSQQIIGSDQDNSNSDDDKSRILFREICKLIINRCSFLDYFNLFEAETDKTFCHYRDLIFSIFKLPGAPEVFRKLKSFTSFISIVSDDLILPLFESLKLFCDNILNLNLSWNSHYQSELSTKLISSQKRLETLSISWSHLDCNSIFWDIISKKETLKRLSLTHLTFTRLDFEGKSSSPPIGQFISLQELYIENCFKMQGSNCLFLASSFTQLSSFHYCHSKYQYYGDKYHPEFIIKILESANTNLKNICLDLYPKITFGIFSAILNYCSKITKLTLYNLSPDQVIAIFNNNFNELRQFSFDCEEEFDANANELLCQMAKNIPESLEAIEIEMDYKDPWIFSADSLRKFFERWCKGREGNKKFRELSIKPMEQIPKIMDDEHFKVIEEYGIQFNMKK